ncbi:hypothetical protein ESCO_004941 [Escovopsis weberi]|uniref:Heterokaryon incompatibility domain-containing protein n=1 Tax=Escovopsis weberi TaxID=150374 RepID=A0A0M8MY59_ESCWE|nr:hypothetical protein ESCO_004941 [Escovopsis weberi]
MVPPEGGATSIRYRPVDSARKEIRLIELQPATTNDINERAVCRIVHERISEASDFIGLSTLYGDIAASETILLNGSVINIPANVAQALRHVRAVFLSPLAPSSDLEQGDLCPPPSPHEQERAAQTTDAPSSPLPPSVPSSPTPLLSRLPQAAHAAALPPQPLAPAKAPRWFLSLLKNFRHRRWETLRTGKMPPVRVWVELLCIDRRSEVELSERRLHMARAYGQAKMVVGWLGLKDSTSDLAIDIVRAWDKCMPATFGEPGDREAHPQDYGPHLQWMGPVAHLSKLPQGVTDPREVPSYVAINNFLNRPYFVSAWILEDMALARFPAFLLGDDIVSWMQVLRLNRVNEEIRDHGAEMFPDELRPLLEYLPLGSVYAFLRDFDMRQRQESTAAVVLSTTSSRGSYSVPGSQSRGRW